MTGDQNTPGRQKQNCRHGTLNASVSTGPGRSLLSQLPQAALAAETEVLFFIEQRNLMGRGIGYIDSLLLASVCLDGSVLLWTLDKRLAALAGELGINGEAGFYPR
jgi:hypothetical protein